MVGRSTTSLKRQRAKIRRHSGERGSCVDETLEVKGERTGRGEQYDDAGCRADRRVGAPIDLSGEAIEDAVEIRLPADSAFLSVLRTATAGLAARLDFTLDEIEDLRIAVDEACAMLLPYAIETAQLLAASSSPPTRSPSR
jgi:hypothetical protein